MTLDFGIFLAHPPFGQATYLDWLIEGFFVSVGLFVCAWILAFLVGSTVGVLRTTPSRTLRAIGGGYVMIFRNIPLIVQLFVWYLIAPELLPQSASVWFKTELHPYVQFFILAVCALGFFTAGRFAEQVRAGIEALSGGQRRAALALGMTVGQTYRYVLLPNAFRIIFPPMTTEMMNLVKNTAVASTIGLLDLAAQAKRLQEFTAHGYESFIAVTLGYVVIAMVVLVGMRFLEARVARSSGLAPMNAEAR